MTNDLTLEELKKVLHYNSDSGAFSWIKKVASCVKVGKPTGTKGTGGYLQIMINYKSYKIHRLAWFYMTGEWPKDQIDHINRIPADNRWSNLRECTNIQNHGNKKMYNNNTSGYKGVYKNANGDKWCAFIGVGGRKKHLGTFKKIHEAALAYNNAAIKYKGEFANINEVSINGEG